jgi:hypothetical protein
LATQSAASKSGSVEMQMSAKLFIDAIMQSAKAKRTIFFIII